MKYPDFDKAFAPTPEIIGLSIESALRKGEKAMKFRYKLTAMLSAAAVLAVAFAAMVFALPAEPRPDVLSQPVLTEPAEEPTVYYTPKGVYYHNIEDCSGMMNAEAHGLTEAKSDGKIPCPACVMGEVDANWSFDESETESTLAPETYGGSVTMDADGSIIALESHPMSTPTPMPTVAPENFSGPAAGVQIVYHTKNGKYFHLEMHCSGMMNAEAHTIADALQAGKIACPVCTGAITAYTTVDPALPDGEEPFDSGEIVPVEITPAKRASDVFLNVFGVYLFDAFADFDYVSAAACGMNSSDGLLTEEIEFCFAQDGWQFTPVTVTIERRDEKILSGNIAMQIFAEFDWPGFCENGSLWQQNVKTSAADTLNNLSMLGAGERDQDAVPEQLYVYFDSELKPSVCVLDCKVNSGFVTLSFDISNDEITLASVHYDVSKA